MAMQIILTIGLIVAAITLFGVSRYLKKHGL
jgi:hypothetical protein